MSAEPHSNSALCFVIWGKGAYRFEIGCNFEPRCQTPNGLGLVQGPIVCVTEQIS